MTQNKKNVDEIAKQLKSILDYIRDCQARVIKGEILSLQGLDKNVEDVCIALAEVPNGEAEVLGDLMTSMISELEVLADTMREQQERLTGTRGR